MPERREVWLVTCLLGNVALMLMTAVDYLVLASAWRTPLLVAYLAFMTGLWATVVPWRRGSAWLRGRVLLRQDARPHPVRPRSESD